MESHARYRSWREVKLCKGSKSSKVRLTIAFLQLRLVERSHQSSSGSTKNPAGPSSKLPCRGETDIQEEDNELNEDEAPLPPRVKALNEAMHNLEDVCSYLDDNGYFIHGSK